MKQQHAPTHSRFSSKTIALGFLSFATLSSCTQQIPSEFLLQQQQQSFTGQTKIQINTKIDMLWVVDNSSSMDVEQAKLRAGFAAFAQKYMQPTWDIRLAVIPTDLYLAAPEFASYRNGILTGSANYASPTMNANFNDTTALFPGSLSSYSVYNAGAWELPGAGLSLASLNPSWNIGTSTTQDDHYSLLNASIFSASVHDGPIPGFCVEYVPYFLWGATHCNEREEPAILANDANNAGSTYNGVSVNNATYNCLNGNNNTGASENINSTTAKCVNTIVNNNIHSGNPIISTMPPSGTAGNQAWINKLVEQFTINVTTGTAGHGSERGMQSVLQLLTDNEKSGSTSSFFRQGSTRVIIFVSDEEDQSMVTETAAQIAGETNYGPFTHYFCDQASLMANNNAAVVNVNNGFCCNASAASCQFGTDGGLYAGTNTALSCKFGNTQYKTITGAGDGTLGSASGTGYTIGVCPDPSKLMAVSTIKTQLDNFFLNLDGPSSTNPNYFVIPIVPLSGSSINTLQTARNYDDQSVITASANAGLNMWAVDRGDRYIQLATQVGNGSQSLDLASSDYSGVMDAIGNEITQQKGTFVLNRAATNQEQTIVEVVHADGSITVVTNNQYTLNGNTLVITDLNLILTFLSTDQIVINYQPLTSV